MPIVGMGAEFVKFKKAQLEQKKMLRDESILASSPSK